MAYSLFTVDMAGMQQATKNGRQTWLNFLIHTPFTPAYQYLCLISAAPPHLLAGAG